MEMDWQSILVIVIAAGCAFWLVRQFLRPFFVSEQDPGCGGTAPLSRPGQLLEVLDPDE